METGLDSIDGRLLNRIQAQFPLKSEPFAVLGRALGISGEDVVHRIQGMKNQGIVRLISPVFNARALGYKTTLVAARVRESRLDVAAQVLCEQPGVGHCYQRDHRFNLWSTLSVSGEVDMEAELERLRNLMGAEVVFDLPTLRTYKIGAYFDASGGECPIPDNNGGHGSFPRGNAELSHAHRVLINELQQDLPLVQRPFDEVSARLGMETDEFLAQCRSLLQRGIMRRYGASINHRAVGYTANAMVCWIASLDKVQVAAKMLAGLTAVSHCYERKINPLWPYNLFCMVHSHNNEACEEVADKVSRETGLKDNVLLFSVKEYKKVRVNYLV